MRLAILIVGALATRAGAAPHCEPAEKTFQCHERAVRAHLGIDQPQDLAAAKQLYSEACGRGHPGSCNNLAVLALRAGELVDGADPKVVLDKACDRFDRFACANARRLATHRDLAVALSLGPTDPTIDPQRAAKLDAATCAAGDVFHCSDAASRERVAALLADECRHGVGTVCFEAAGAAREADAVALWKLGCKSGDGHACQALAEHDQAHGAKPAALAAWWRGACTDKDSVVTREDSEKRHRACASWAEAAAPGERRQVVKVLADYCDGSDSGMCDLVEDAWQRAGDPAHAFAFAKAQCEADASSPSCTSLAVRYLKGNGTPRALDKAVALLGGTCRAPATWAACRDVAREAAAHRLPDVDAMAIYDTFCPAEPEACYLGARAAETDTAARCASRWDSLGAVKVAYDALCTKRYRDACSRAGGLCSRAMAEYLKPTSCHGGYGIGDGSWSPSEERITLDKLCPPAAWTPEVRRAIGKEDAYHRELDDFREGRSSPARKPKP